MPTLLAFFVFALHSLFALEIDLSGRVLNQDNYPIAFVEIEIPELGLKDTTDSNGDWAIAQTIDDPEPLHQALESSFQFQNGRLSGWAKSEERIDVSVLDLRGAVLKEWSLQTGAGPWNWDLKEELQALGNKLLLLKIQMAEKTAVIRSHGTQVLAGSVLPKRRLNAESTVANLLYKLQGELITEDELTQFKDHIEKYLVERNVEGEIQPDTLDRGFAIARVQARFTGGKSDREVVARMGYSKLNNRYSGKIYSVKSLDGSVYDFVVHIETLDSLHHKIGRSQDYPFDTYFGDLELPTFMNGNLLPEIHASVPTLPLSPNDTLKMFFEAKDDTVDGGRVVLWEYQYPLGGAFIGFIGDTLQFALPSTKMDSLHYALKVIDSDSNVIIDTFTYVGMVEAKPWAEVLFSPAKVSINDSLRISISLNDSMGRITSWKYALEDTSNWVAGEEAAITLEGTTLETIVFNQEAPYPYAIHLMDDDGNDTLIYGEFMGVYLDAPIGIEVDSVGIQIPSVHKANEEGVYEPYFKRLYGEAADSIAWKVELKSAVDAGWDTLSYEPAVEISQGFSFVKSQTGEYVVFLKVFFEGAEKKEKIFKSLIYISGDETSVLFENNATSSELILGTEAVLKLNDGNGILSSSVDWGDGSLIENLTDALFLNHNYQQSGNYEIVVNVLDSVGESFSDTLNLVIKNYLELSGALSFDTTGGQEFTVSILGTDISAQTTLGSFTLNSDTLMPMDSLVLLVSDEVDTLGRVVIEDPRAQDFNYTMQSISVNGTVVNGVLNQVVDLREVQFFFKQKGAEAYRKADLLFQPTTGVLKGKVFDGNFPKETEYYFYAVGLDAFGKRALVSPLDSGNLQFSDFNLQNLASDLGYPKLELSYDREVPQGNRFTVNTGFSDLPNQTMDSILVLFGGDTLLNLRDTLVKKFEILSPPTLGVYTFTTTVWDEEGLSATSQDTVTVSADQLVWNQSVDTLNIDEVFTIEIADGAPIELLTIVWEEGGPTLEDTCTECSLTHVYEKAGLKNFSIQYQREPMGPLLQESGSVYVSAYFQGSITLIGSGAKSIGEVEIVWENSLIGSTLINTTADSLTLAVFNDSLNLGEVVPNESFTLKVNGFGVLNGDLSTHAFVPGADTKINLRQIHLSTSSPFLTVGKYNSNTDVDSLVLEHTIGSDVREYTLLGWAPGINLYNDYLYVSNPLSSADDTMRLVGYSSGRKVSFTDVLTGDATANTKSFSAVASDRAMPQMVLSGAEQVYGGIEENYSMSCSDLGEAGAVDCFIKFKTDSDFVLSTSRSHVFMEEGKETVYFKGVDFVGNISLDSLEVQVVNDSGVISGKPTLSTQTPDDTLVFNISYTDANGLDSVVWSDNLTNRIFITDSGSLTYVIPDKSVIPQEEINLVVYMDFYDKMGNRTRDSIALLAANDRPVFSVGELFLQTDRDTIITIDEIYDFGTIVSYRFESPTLGVIDTNANAIRIPAHPHNIWYDEMYSVTLTDDDGNSVTQSGILKGGYFFTDKRDGKSYRYNPNNGWMIDNLNYGTYNASMSSAIGYKYCPTGFSWSCDSQGALYTWKQARDFAGTKMDVNSSASICPENTHLPSAAEALAFAALDSAESNYQSVPQGYSGTTLDMTAIWSHEASLNSLDHGQYMRLAGISTSVESFADLNDERRFAIRCVLNQELRLDFSLTSPDSIAEGTLTFDFTSARELHPALSNLSSDSLGSITVSVAKIGGDGGGDLVDVPVPASKFLSLYLDAKPGYFHITVKSEGDQNLIQRDFFYFSKFQDTRDNQNYKSVYYNNLEWMAENLNYAPAGNTSSCYDGVSANCEEYGRLYPAEIAYTGLENEGVSSIWDLAEEIPIKGICPTYWRLPTTREFITLLDSLKNREFSYKDQIQIPATIGVGTKAGAWNYGYELSPKVPLNFVPSGYRASSGIYWQSGTETSGDQAMSVWTDPGSTGIYENNFATFNFTGITDQRKYDISTPTALQASVRCVR